jgi:hypothetical protein
VRAFKGTLLAFVLVTAAAAQSADPPLSDTRLTVHTLLREDIFAGFMNDNDARLARGERNIAILLKDRPDQRANLLAWQAGATTYRAVRAHEAGKPEEFERQFAAARAGFTEAAALSNGKDGVPAITGGTLATFADRLPEKHRAAAWSQAYDNYAKLWQLQGADIEKMPVHFKGELLAGLTQSAQRTGRADESARYLEKMLVVLQGTSYEATAQKWKADPASAATTNLTCKNCHSPGRLSARLKALEGQQ